MRALVLGGTRFVGLRLVHALAREGFEITILNRGRLQAQLPPGVKRLGADRRNPDEVRSALSGLEFDVVFDITGYQVKNLVPMVEIFQGRLQHYVFQSTCGVYAPSQLVPIREDFPFLERTGTAPGLASYEVDKVECEEFLLRLHREKGFPATILRCPAMYGPHNWMDDREGSFFYRLLQGRRVLVPGDGESFLHFVCVDDVARAHIAVVRAGGRGGEAFNIADPEAVTINGYIDIIADIVGADSAGAQDRAGPGAPQSRTPKGPEGATDSAGAQDRASPSSPHSRNIKIHMGPSTMGELKGPVFPFPWPGSPVYDIHKAEEHLGFRPLFDIRSGLQHTYDWWRRERGVEGVEFRPGKLGHDVDLAYEDELSAQILRARPEAG
ncbi:MAG: NAD-dependent epimerase/dehydratase family protein [Dehalococcoidia bacterium]